MNKDGSTIETNQVGFPIQQAKESKSPLDQYHARGAELSKIVNTEDGRRQAEVVKAKIEETCQKVHPNPTSADLPSLGVAMGDMPDFGREKLLEELRYENELLIAKRAMELLNGEPMNNLEEAQYFAFPARTSSDEKRSAIQRDQLQRKMIGAALAYAESLSKSPDEIPDIPKNFRPSAGALKFDRINIKQANEAFNSGWKSVKST